MSAHENESDRESRRREQLPLPDFDHVPLGALPSRIASLDESGVVQLLDFERAHGNG